MAYAAVISLKHTIQRLKNPINKPRITKSACEKLNSLISILKKLDDESSRSVDRRVINELDDKTRDAVWKVEDVLESCYSQILPSQGGLDEKGVEEEMNLFLEKVKMLGKEYNRVLHIPFCGKKEEALPATVPSAPVNKSTTVGLSDLTLQIKNQLLHGGDSSLKIVVSLLGMAGIGKTHLATNIYHRSDIDEHFHSRLWLSVGPKYETENIRVDIVAQIEGKPRNLYKKEYTEELRYLIAKHLGGRRILIVLDDVWSRRAFSNVIRLFPDLEKTGSRVLLTTRIQEATPDDWSEYGSGINNEMPFLDSEESWNLLWPRAVLKFWWP